MKAERLAAFLTISLFVMESTAYSATMTEFYNRMRAVDVLEDQFKRWLSTPTTIPELRERYLQEYLTTFDRTFNKSDEWIFEKFMDDAELKHIVNVIGTEFHDVEYFFGNVTVTFKRAYMQRVRVAMERNDKDYKTIVEVSRVREAKLVERLDAKLKEISSVEWKRQFQIDVREFLLANQMSKRIHADLRDFLDRKYPFRQWLVIAHDSRVNNWGCGKGFPFVFRRLFPSRDVIVTQVERSVEPDLRRRTLWLKRIENDKYDLFCTRRSKDIVEEATPQCEKTDVPLLNVFAHHEKSGAPLMAASKASMLAMKTVRRGSLVLCEQLYTVALFG